MEEQFYHRTELFNWKIVYHIFHLSSFIKNVEQYYTYINFYELPYLTRPTQNQFATHRVPFSTLRIHAIIAFETNFGSIRSLGSILLRGLMHTVLKINRK